MNEKFFKLPQTKTDKIMNSAYKVFSENSYKKAATEDIAELAEISKGLLFHYFASKKELYIFIHNYAFEFMKKNVDINELSKTNDLFEIIFLVQEKKLDFMKKYPYIFKFLFKANHEEDKSLSEYLSRFKKQSIENGFDFLYKRADLSRFKKDVDITKVWQLIKWTAEGFSDDLLKKKDNIEKEDFDELKAYLLILKKNLYKEEFTN